jgi:hypothetical protein
MTSTQGSPTNDGPINRLWATRREKIPLLRVGQRDRSRFGLRVLTQQEHRSKARNAAVGHIPLLEPGAVR